MFIKMKISEELNLIYDTCCRCNLMKWLNVLIYETITLTFNKDIIKLYN